MHFESSTLQCFGAFAADFAAPARGPLRVRFAMRYTLTVLDKVVKPQAEGTRQAQHLALEILLSMPGQSPAEIRPLHLESCA